MIAWVRWTHGADGQGSPAYCSHCQRTRGQPFRCGDCNEPRLWEENLPIAELWGAMQTQWRTGFAGPTGMDYPTALALMPVYELADQREALHGLQLMEGETLKILADRREKPDG